MQPKFCNKCGNALKEGDKFCRKCGAPIKMINANAAPQQPQPQQSQFRPQPQTPVQQAQFRPVPQPQTQPLNTGAYAINDNLEGTVLLGDLNRGHKGGKTVKKGSITLSLEEMLSGCSKVVDFGTGKRFEIVIPAGITPGDVITVENTGIIDKESGGICTIELTTEIE
ncbi:MAG: zinc-ribbon domain-containing protein [Mogibacterium sp.]|nr:zinc-ribbon domain-containing protein [Mogibacterium sp.]